MVKFKAVVFLDKKAACEAAFGFVLQREPKTKNPNERELDMEKLYRESKELFEAILALESVEACEAFFEDLCTIKEILDMSQRLDTAILLSKGLSYQKIAEQVAVSSATIGRVSKCLNYGTGGYRAALEKLEEDQ